MKSRLALAPLGFLGTALIVGLMCQSMQAQEKPVEKPTPGVAAAEGSTASSDNSEPQADAPAPEDLPTAGTPLSYTINSLFMLIAATLVLFMQAGFALVEVGLNSSKNAINIMFKNLMDLCIGVILYWLWGFNVMYPGSDFAGQWFPPLPSMGTIEVARDFPPTQADLARGYASSADFMFQVAFAATAATIVSGAVAGRLKFSAYLLYSAIITGLVYPVSGFWKWGGGALQASGFQDFAGSLEVHAIGGFAGLMGAIALGPRLGRFGKDGKSHPIPGHNIPIACLGVFILLIGWYGFNPGSMLKYTGYTAAEATCYIALTTTLAAAAGANVAMLVGWGLFGKPDLTMGMNGMLAGLVGITANCDRVTQGESVLIGAIAGVLVVMGIIALEKLRIDDPVGAFPVHGVCGLWGGLATGLFGDFNGLEKAVKTADGVVMEPIASRMEFFLIQLQGSLIIAAWAILTMGIVFFGLKAIGLLRVTPEEETQGLDIGEHGMHAYGLDSPPMGL